ncbi:MAG: hypothetical protein UV74_C0013G0390 [Candidatus Woesebacteria bacterium GW2011_GWB1_43_14]|uniref:Glycosyltransferase RgtA/B/C/D-like domain-containing protein n=1 Tax=Candidatus Woesebacteria bacterium GW2011_GWB1_43_14 TaxID=1618578 RepID=A0A0G1GEH5_9BACT|nr:MAG: hypothetical protein UT21_C0001G0102 [Candidatus Woesebacteria bacterium GW2011_GWA1_39_11b]KKS78314.1 MAG: hypothetical protein UV51_C0001G0030 [Candidatus Woesebacteria bacterium GW2011_GWC1_42_9]KKS97268.1 MAG: hypothetical protein UV74_C0013G0390 [Candidatus Woesebacteria bacterium GW2011_GWB1_43_14]
MINFNKEKMVILLSVIVFLVALLLRAYNLTVLPVFADEAIYIRWAQVMQAEPTLRFLPLSDGKQPLFMWVMILLFKLISDPLSAGRFLSVLTGLGTMSGIIVLTYLLFRSTKASMYASLIYAVMPFAVFFDRMALVDSQLSMFGVWIFIFTLLSVRFVRLDMAMLAGFSLGGALLTKSPAMFFSLLIPVTIIFIKISENKWKQTIQLIKVLGGWVVIWGIGYAMFNILRLGPNFHLLGARNRDYVYPFSHLWENFRDPFVFHFDRAIEWLTTMGAYLLLPLAAVGVVGNYKKYFKEILFLLIIGFAPILIQAEFAKVFTARYVYFTLPYFVILASSAFIVFSGNLQKYLFIVLVVFIGLSTHYDLKLLFNPEKAPLPRSERSGYLEEWTAGTGIKEVADYLRMEYIREPEKKIVVGTEGYFGTLPDGLQIYLNDIREITIVGVGLSISEIPDSLKESKLAGNRTFLVANSSRLNFDKEFSEYGLKIISSYKKADRPFGLREYVVHGPYDTFYFFELE